ncbi:MAG: transcriptional regulator NrdR [Alphaproteobacteria bacterium]
MRCPFCGNIETQVKDSRLTEDSSAIRRRRECPECASRFTTFERVFLRELTIVKKNGDKMPFNREKLSKSIRLALRKRPVTEERIEKVITSIQRKLESSGEAEIQSQKVGEYVMDALARLDHVAYIRFASVYKDFTEVKDFVESIENLPKK